MTHTFFLYILYKWQSVMVKATWLSLSIYSFTTKHDLLA